MFVCVWKCCHVTISGGGGILNLRHLSVQRKVGFISLTASIYDSIFADACNLEYLCSEVLAKSDQKDNLIPRAQYWHQQIMRYRGDTKAADLCRPEKRHSWQSVSNIYSRKNPGKTPLGASIEEKPAATRVSRWTWLQSCAWGQWAIKRTTCCRHRMCLTLNRRWRMMRGVWFTGCSLYLNAVFVLNVWR